MFKIIVVVWFHLAHRISKSPFVYVLMITFRSYSMHPLFWVLDFAPVLEGLIFVGIILVQVSKPGSVNVEKLMNIERYSHVMHISSTVTTPCFVNNLDERGILSMFTTMFHKPVGQCPNTKKNSPRKIGNQRYWKVFDTIMTSQLGKLPSIIANQIIEAYNVNEVKKIKNESMVHI